MKIDEVIEKLTKIRDEHGNDIEVEWYDSSGYDYPINDIVFDECTLI